MDTGKKITVLYVDDEEINLFLLKATFKNKYQIITALSGTEGLQQLSLYHHDIIVVISDMKMPGMDGLEFIQMANEQYKNIAYFILTGYALDDRIESAIKSKLVQEFFTKPFDTDKLTEAIELAAKTFRPSK